MKTNILTPLLCAALPISAFAQVVYSNDFELNTAGFSAGGVLPALSRATLPTDSSGPASTSTSTWLGKVGDGVAKSAFATEIVKLDLLGLVAGTTYQVNFDLLIGASWDGAANFFGSDLWRLTANGNILVDTSFANGAQGINFGAYSPQRYTDQNYINPNGADVARFTGADQSWSANQAGNYAADYAIYYFGRGAGNPNLSFVASGTAALLEFSRFGTAGDTSADEYWALDNVSVVAQSIVMPPLTPPQGSAVPEPSTYALAGAGLLALIAALKRGKLRPVSPA